MHIVGAGQGALVALCLGISRYLAVKLVHTLHPLPFSTSQLKSPRIPSRQSVKPLLALALAWLMLSLMTAQQAYAADDYSDAPTTYGNPTHLIAGTLKLGANAPDSETTLTPLDGTGDDVNGIDDEDGVSGFPALMVGATSYFLPATHISATGTGTLHAWIDFNQDGVFSATEYKAVAVTAGTLARSLSWNGITVSSAGTTYARFRFTSSVLTDNAGTSSLDERATVAASDGEVEDYPLTIEPLVIPTNYCRSETLIASGNFTTNRCRFQRAGAMLPHPLIHRSSVVLITIRRMAMLTITPTSREASMMILIRQAIRRQVSTAPCRSRTVLPLR